MSVPLLDRSTTPQLAADALRDRVLAGQPRPASPDGTRQVRDAVRDGRAATAGRQWPEVGTADVRFRRGVTALAAGNRLVRGLAAELRLALHLVVPDPQSLHEPFLELNGRILRPVEDGDGACAAELLEGCLDDAEATVVGAVVGG